MEMGTKKKLELCNMGETRRFYAYSEHRIYKNAKNDVKVNYG